ncbi:MAG: hypothetical protein Q4E45_05310 [Eubacteriales bacterium]|nr:hypothetical protein [Eubacteriales bacterium]
MYAMCVYRLDRNGSVSVTDGVLYDKSAKKGPYFSVTHDSFNAAKGKAIAERKYNQKLDAVMKKEKYLRYDPIINWYQASSQSGADSGKTSSGGKTKTGSSGPKVNTGEAATLYYTHQTTVDNTTGAKTANVLVPYGWRLSHSINWNFIDTTSPGVATVTLTSPDGKAVIKLISNQQFYDMHKNSSHVAEGPDMGLYYTNLHYPNAGKLQTLGLQWEGFSDARLVKSFTVPDGLLRIAQEGEKIKLQSGTSGTGATPLASEGTVAQKLYQSGNQYIEYLTMVTAAASQANTGHAVLTAISWNVPLNCMFVADSRQSYDRYRDVFLNVIANSGFTTEFHFVNLRYGSVISNLISQGLLEQSRRYLQSESRSWISEYESSPGYDSDKLMSQWSDVIKEQNEYTTLDGETIKVSTAYDTVYQDGDRIYMGPEGQSPYGWTRLYPN